MGKEGREEMKACHEERRERKRVEQSVGRKEDTYKTPRYCTRTLRYTDIYMDGNLYGETNYYDNNGNIFKAGLTN